MKTFKSKFAGMAVVVALAAGIANPVFADDSKTLPIAAQMYTLRNSGTLEEQLAILNRAGVSAVETVDMQKVSPGEPEHASRKAQDQGHFFACADRQAAR